MNIFQILQSTLVHSHKLLSKKLTEYKLSSNNDLLFFIYHQYFITYPAK